MTLDQAGKDILSQSRYYNFFFFSDRPSNHDEGPSFPLKYTVDISTGKPQKTLGTTLETKQKCCFVTRTKSLPICSSNKDKTETHKKSCSFSSEENNKHEMRNP